jgi:hypothetical protein
VIEIEAGIEGLNAYLSFLPWLGIETWSDPVKGGPVTGSFGTNKGLDS